MGIVLTEQAKGHNIVRIRRGKNPPLSDIEVVIKKFR